MLAVWAYLLHRPHAFGEAYNYCLTGCSGVKKRHKDPQFGFFCCGLSCSLCCCWFTKCLAAFAQGEISMRIKCVQFSIVPPRHAKLASHRDARCAHRTWAGRLLGTMTQNDLFCCGNEYADQVLSFLVLWGRFQIVSQRRNAHATATNLNRRVVIQLVASTR